MKILIVDDEMPARERLKQLIDDLPDMEVAGEAAGGREALEQHDRNRPDVVLLDIRMPGMDGLEVARHLAEMERPPAIIFTTAYDQFAIDAFDTHAAAYLLKPVRREKLQRALDQASRPNRAQLAEIAAETGDEEGRQNICARVGGQLQLIPVEDVYYFRAEDKYVVVRHAKGEVLIEDSLKSLEDEYPQRFQRIHRNALVAKNRVSGLEKTSEGRFRLRLRDIDDTLDVSRRMVPTVRRALGLK